MFQHHLCVYPDGSNGRNLIKVTWVNDHTFKLNEKIQRENGKILSKCVFYQCVVQFFSYSTLKLEHTNELFLIWPCISWCFNDVLITYDTNVSSFDQCKCLLCSFCKHSTALLVEEKQLKPMCATFVWAGHPLDGSFIIVVLSNWKGEDSDLENNIKKNNDTSIDLTDTFTKYTAYSTTTLLNTFF